MFGQPPPRQMPLTLNRPALCFQDPDHCRGSRMFPGGLAGGLVADDHSKARFILGRQACEGYCEFGGPVTGGNQHVHRGALGAGLCCLGPMGR